ncbi:appetite-regulating hormone [Tiliqua scincoides]|uniref:appetite-regulating hormone n=1 Tax=Tiliqua scincoides TaxID=71010 RepID=UPI003462AB74
MVPRAILLGIILVYSLWAETTLAGSSFLSPEQPRTQQRKVPPKPTPRVHRRDAEAFPDTHETEGDTNNIEIKFKVPFEIGMRISEEQYKDYGQILEQFLEDILAEDNKENEATH